MSETQDHMNTRPTIETVLERIDAFRQHFDNRFAGLEKDVAELKSRFAGLEKDVAELKSRFAGLEKDVAELRSHFDDFEKRTDRHFEVTEKRLDITEKRLDSLEKLFNLTRDDLLGLRLEIRDLRREVIEHVSHVG
jgi:predicted  nucleic acid-binding Zn-ribbon protein